MFTDLLDGLYVHLPLKRAMYGIDPVQQLRRLNERARVMSDDAFHREIATIMSNLRDAHTVYIAPSPFLGSVARLPFLVEQFGSETAPGFLVSKVIPELIDDPEFVMGVEVLEWNGVPIAEAIRRRGEVERGGRPDSAMARALDSLTLRPLGLGPAPDEKWVIVGYRTGDAQPLREHRFEWRFIDPGPGPDEPHPTAPAATATAMHPDRALVRRAKKLSFNTGLWTTEDYDRMFALGASRDASGWLTGKFQDNVSARSITVDGRDYGYLRLWSFDLSDDDGFVAEVISMLGQLPQDGLIIDLRGNPGGLIWAAERLLQLFTPVADLAVTVLDHRVRPDAGDDRRPAEPSRAGAVATHPARGDRHRRGLLAVGHDHARSSAATTSARCTAARSSPSSIRPRTRRPTCSPPGSPTTASAPSSVSGGRPVRAAPTCGGSTRSTACWPGRRISLPRLPNGVGFTMSVRRATRIGASDGAPIEDVGIVGHRSYAMTRDDLLDGNSGLHTYCARLLEAEPSTSMTVTWEPPKLSVAVGKLDRVDVYVDTRPHGSFDVDDGCELELAGVREEIRVEGYQGANIRQVRVIRIA